MSFAGRLVRNVNQILVMSSLVYSRTDWLSTYIIIAAAASEPEANEQGSSLISRRLHYRGL